VKKDLNSLSQDKAACTFVAEKRKTARTLTMAYADFLSTALFST
jgi:hypothetical protein